MSRQHGKTAAVNQAIHDNAATPTDASLMLQDMVMYRLCIGNYVDVNGEKKIQRVDPMKAEKDKQYVTLEVG